MPASEEPPPMPARARPADLTPSSPAADPRTHGDGGASAGPEVLVVSVAAPILRSDIKGLCTRLCGLLDGSGAPRVVCDVAAFTDPDAVTIDALAQFQLAVRRRGKSIELRNASARMRGLLALMGLNDVFVFASDEPL